MRTGTGSGIFSLVLGNLDAGTPLSLNLVIFDGDGNLVAGPQDFNNVLVPINGKMSLSISEVGDCNPLVTSDDSRVCK